MSNGKFNGLTKAFSILPDGTDTPIRAIHCALDGCLDQDLIQTFCPLRRRCKK
jgi:hypothetical protein